ncbi:hypothetical protein H2201_005448 [Coniosporium apollinis]|uniref:Uncharacterized protein n=1 Tax=Coniosporium apollinis TaxID=61459 RepID=A0ABQ9NQE1_9PEZI|nr:hypothetical protein H2201_005448 [Coniosporium apollinis]
MRLEELLREKGLYKLDWDPKITQEKLRPTVDKMEEEFEWITSRKIRLTWCVLTFNRWVRNKMAGVRGVDSPSSRKRHRFTVSVNPESSPNAPKRGKAIPKPQLSGCLLRITLSKDSATYAAIVLIDLAKDKQPRIGADGDLNVSQLSFKKLVAALEAQIQFDPETQSVVYEDPKKGFVVSTS